MTEHELELELDPVELEIFRNQLESIAEEMGQVLVRGAYSPNITERQDCSTALFDVPDCRPTSPSWSSSTAASRTGASTGTDTGAVSSGGRMLAQAEHIPVHLGAMPDAVDAVLEQSHGTGDVFVLNDPFTGGTHLPDVTLVSPLAPDGEIVGYAVSRAHHADVGGMTPGSMPAGAREIYQEGLRLPPVRLRVDGERNEDVESLLLANVRNPTERRADLRAQLAAHDRAEDRLGELLAARGSRQALFRAYDAVLEYSRERFHAEIADLPNGQYDATAVMDGDGVSETDIRIETTVRIDDAHITVDFSGTASQVPGNVNAPRSVVKSAVYFVIRCLIGDDVPPNEGCYEPITVKTPAGSLLNPEPPAAVVGGNVETSQRVADVVFSALAEAAPERVPACGQGTMNNLIIGNPAFQYYETIGGGAGANPDSDGLSGVQVGMTNTLNTPIEALEAAYPIRAETYALRDGSGGAGQYHGGDGLIRELTVLADATVSLLTDRRRHAPCGLAGGADGQPGQNLIGGDPVPPKTTREIEAGTTVRIETPGGGGWGTPDATLDN